MLTLTPKHEAADFLSIFYQGFDGSKQALSFCNRISKCAPLWCGTQWVTRCNLSMGMHEKIRHGTQDTRSTLAWWLSSASRAAFDCLVTEKWVNLHWFPRPPSGESMFHIVYRCPPARADPGPICLIWHQLGAQCSAGAVNGDIISFTIPVGNCGWFEDILGGTIAIGLCYVQQFLYVYIYIYISKSPDLWHSKGKSLSEP